MDLFLLTGQMNTYPVVVLFSTLMSFLLVVHFKLWDYFLEVFRKDIACDQKGFKEFSYALPLSLSDWLKLNIGNLIKVR